MALCSNARRFAEDLAKHCGVVEKVRMREEVERDGVKEVGSLGGMVAVWNVLRSVGGGLEDQQRCI